MSTCRPLTFFGAAGKSVLTGLVSGSLTVTLMNYVINWANMDDCMNPRRQMFIDTLVLAGMTLMFSIVSLPYWLPPPVRHQEEESRLNSTPAP